MEKHFITLCESVENYKDMNLHFDTFYSLFQNIFILEFSYFINIFTDNKIYNQIIDLFYLPLKLLLIFI